MGKPGWKGIRSGADGLRQGPKGEDGFGRRMREDGQGDVNIGAEGGEGVRMA